MRIYVATEEDIIRTWIDLYSLGRAEDNRIKDMEYRFFVGLVKAQKIFGTINSASVDSYVKSEVGRPKLSRKSFLTYLNSLIKKGWVLKDNKTYSVHPGLDLYGKEFKGGGVATIMLEIERVHNGMDREDTGEPG